MSKIIADTATVNGVRLNFRLEGPDGAPVVALVNSLGTDLTMWDPQIAALTQRYRVLRHDTRGHGKSPAPPAPYSLDNLADDVLGLLSHVGAEPFHVVGISLGGLVAASIGLRRPRGLASVAICDSRIDVPPEGAKAIDDRVNLVRAQGMKPLAEAMIQRWFTAATLKAAPAYLDAVRRMLLETSIEGFAGCAAAIKNSDLSARIANLYVPALFVVGAQDVALPIPIMEQVQTQIARARSAIIPDAGHLSNLEQPAAFNAALLAFLDGVKA